MKRIKIEGLYLMTGAELVATVKDSEEVVFGTYIRYYEKGHHREFLSCDDGRRIHTSRLKDLVIVGAKQKAWNQNLRRYPYFRFWNYILDGILYRLPTLPGFTIAAIWLVFFNPISIIALFCIGLLLIILN